jgi:phospholipid/cholesterol/gamma-HCH transport system substrate-binding protein
MAAALLAVSCAPSGGKTLVAEFADVGDLVGRASVQQSDAVVGRVVGIKLVQRDAQWLARVRMSLRPGTRTPEGVRAVVRSTSLLGEKFVDLELPSNPGPELHSGAVIPSSQTGKAPELEEVFRQLGAILATGALTDLGNIVNASAMIVEGQQADIGRVIDGTAKLVQSIANEKDALASALTDLNSAAKTLRGGSGTIDRALRTSADALALVASQRDQLDALVVQLDRLGKPLGDLTRRHAKDIDAQVKMLHRIVPELYAARDKLSQAVHKLPAFTKLFARAAPGDYVQLDIQIQLPAGLPLTASSASDVLWGATR